MSIILQKLSDRKITLV